MKDDAFYIDTTALEKGTKAYVTMIQSKAVPLAMPKVALQLLNNVVNGSPKQPVVPPILHGFLRGSGSVFFENKLIHTSKNDVTYKKEGGGEPQEPNRSHNAGENRITIGFNAAYAARWHENRFTPGERSRQSGNVGNKFISKHLESDREELLGFFAKLIKKVTG